MRKIKKEAYKFENRMVESKKAIKILKERDQNYKAELAEDFPDKELSFYSSGDFEDLCRGPHVEDTSKIGAFKLTSIAGAYWRENEDRPMLTRIYGAAFPTKEDLDDYLKWQEEMKKRDHRKLNKELGLFMFSDYGPGFAFRLPKGEKLWQIMIGYWRELHEEAGYVEINTPIMLRKELWEQSGHMKNYSDKMYFAKTGDDESSSYAIKPMNCPGGILVYKNDLKSYRDLPLRVGELGLVHRYESSGEMHGLMRVRQFTQDDAHIYMMESQMKDEVKKALELTFKIYKDYGLEIDHIELSTRPEKFIGDVEKWKLAEKILEEVLEESEIDYKINAGDGAFYGPKIDFHLNDSMGKTWQCGTIQLDFAQPENFDLEYVNEEGNRERPIMIHRTIYGGIERFIGIIIENFAGHFPLWLNPVQIKVLPITSKHNDYSKELVKKLKEDGLRVELDDRDERVGLKIRDAQMERVNYMLIIGDKELEAEKVAVRNRNEEDLGMMRVDDFLDKVKKEIEDKV
jgi:threonyl-tRNA synthetase